MSLRTPHSSSSSKSFTSLQSDLFQKYYFHMSCSFNFLLCLVVGPDAGGSGPRGVGEADPETAVLCLAHLQPRGRQNIPSRGAGQFSVFTTSEQH